MFTSVLEWVRRERLPLLVSLLCLVCGGVYQLFSHGVGSLWMTLCFVPALCYGIVDWLWYCRFGGLGRGFARDLLGAGAATATAGMALCGILEIAGGESPYGWLFWLLAGMELLAAMLLLWKKPEEGKNHE